MKKPVALLGLLLLISAAGLYFFVFNKKEGKKGITSESTVPVIVTSKHSEAFNQSVANFMNAYYAMTEAFVNWDTAAAGKQAESFKATLDSFSLDEIIPDSPAYRAAVKQLGSIQSELTVLISAGDLTERRYALNMLSQLLFEMLKTIQYDKLPVYYQECPMALDNYEKSAYWLSAYREMEKRRNPYLGLYDPTYKSGMLKCGSTKDSVLAGIIPN
jgi:hypothetical protein